MRAVYCWGCGGAVPQSGVRHPWHPWDKLCASCSALHSSGAIDLDELAAGALRRVSFRGVERLTVESMSDALERHGFEIDGEDGFEMRSEEWALWIYANHGRCGLLIVELEEDRGQQHFAVLHWQLLGDIGRG